MLVDGGLLTEEQLMQAIADQKKSKLKLGQFLVREGIVSEAQVVDLLSRQLRLKKYRPDKYPVNMDLAKLIPADIAHKYQVAPLKKSGFLLTIAMVDPMDINALDTIELLTNTEVEVIICTEQELNQLTGSLYGSYTAMGGSLVDMQDMEYDQSEEEGPTVAGSEELEMGSLLDMAEGAPVVRLTNSILSQAIRESASDIHISPEKGNVQVRFRIDGRLREVPAPPKSMFLPIVSRLKILANMDIAVSRIPQDGRFTIKMDNKEINIRASTIPTIYGENIVLRLLDTSGGILSMKRLGMSRSNRDKVEGAIIKPYGMILTAGPTGSGKSTSLYSILKQLNKPDINIITLEDPVEYRVPKIRQVQLNLKAGMTFANGLRSILRQDPDVIMVGEIRDAETATIAVQAALTGHRVLSTVHTNDAAGAITRFIDMGIEPFLVASVMLVSIAQRLVRKVCPYCAESYTPSRAAIDFWDFGDRLGEAEFKRGKGCFQCSNSGYKGRTGLYEIMVIEESIQEMILQKKSAQDISRFARKAGILKTLKEDAANKVLKGITTLDEAASAVIV